MAPRTVTIKTVSTNEANVSKRTITHDIYIDGEFQVGNIANVLDAIDLKIQYCRQEQIIADRNCVCTELLCSHQR